MKKTKLFLLGGALFLALLGYFVNSNSTKTEARPIIEGVAAEVWPVIPPVH